MITVTVNGSGGLIDLRLTPEAGRWAMDRLAAEILRTMRRGQASPAERVAALRLGPARPLALADLTVMDPAKRQQAQVCLKSCWRTTGLATPHSARRSGVPDLPRVALTRTRLNMRSMVVRALAH
jgi:hypothetical protein